MDQRYVIALELSGSQVKGAAAKAPISPYAPMTIPSIEAIVHEDKATCVQYGRLQNLLEGAKETSTVLQKLNNIPSLVGARVTGAYVGLSGRSLSSTRTTAELSLPYEQEITDETLRCLFVEAAKPISGDRQVLKVLPRKYVIDNQINQNPVGSMGTNLRGEFTVITCNPVNRRNLEMLLNERLQLPVKKYVVTPLAIADMVLGEEEKQLGCVLVDVGAQTTTVQIYKDRALQHLATLPLGSQNITRDIATGMNLTAERAEQAKRDLGNALPETPASAADESHRINSYVQARTGEIIANIVAQIDFAGFKTTDLASGFVITGRGAKLKNFAQALESQGKLKVRHASIPASVTVSDKSVEPGDYTSIISLVLHGAYADDPEGCVVFPVKEPVAETKSFDPYEGETTDSDNTWMLDSDKETEAKNKQQQTQQQAPAPVKETPEPKPSKGSLLAKLKGLVSNIFTEDDEDDDVNLD